MLQNSCINSADTGNFYDDYFNDFLTYCKECNIVFAYELEPVDYVAFRTQYNLNNEIVKDIKSRIFASDSNIPIEKLFICARKELQNGIENEYSNEDEATEHIDETYIEHSNKDIYNDDFKSEMANVKIESLDLSVRSHNCLKKQNINTVAKLLEYTDEELLNIQYLGQNSLKEIRRKLNEIDIDLVLKCDENKTMTCNTILISDNLREIIEYLLNDKLNDIHPPLEKNELAILESVNCAIEELGSEICLYTYLEPNKIAPLLNMLSGFVNATEIIASKVEILNRNFSQIDKKILDCKTGNFIIAFATDEETIKIMAEIVGDCEYIKHLKKCFYSIAQNNDAFILVQRFIAFLKITFDDMITNIFDSIYKNDTMQKVLESRAIGGTLESTGQLLGVTRERVRQIEKKVQNSFDRLNGKHRIIPRIYAMRGGDSVITERELMEILPSKSKELLYLLRNVESSQYTYDKELNLFLVGKDVSDSLLDDCINSMPEILFVDEMIETIADIVENVGIHEEWLKNAINKKYKLTGKMYHKSRISLTEIYTYTLEKYYPHGLKLFDDRELDRFKNNIYETFGEMALPKNNRAIDARVAEIGVLCDRGTYIHKNYVDISNELINEINVFIENCDRSALSYLELFEMFKDDLLLKSNISNRYYLQGVLKLNFIDKYYFSRDSVSKSKNYSIDDELKLFVNEKGEVSKAEIKSAFNGISEAMLSQTLARCTEIISIDNALYMSVDCLNIVEDDYKIEKFVENNISAMPVSSRKLYENMHIQYSDFLFRNNIVTHTKLFGVLKYMFSDKFRFSRPFIGHIGNEELSNISIVKNYISELPVIKIENIIGFCEEQHLRFLGWASMLRQLEDEYIRVDTDELVSMQTLDVDDEKLNKIKSTLNEDISIKGYIAARKMDTFLYYPDIGIKWNSFLLKSIVQQFIDDITIVDAPTTDTYALTSIFISSDFQIDDYEELLRWAIKSEHSKEPFNNINEIKDWLLNEGLINNDIPKFLLEKQYVYIDEYNKIIVP